MPPLPQLVFTVTNDLVYDQRMIRICHSLAKAGYQVKLIGRCYKDSPGLKTEAFDQKRLRCWFRKGFAFYAEYNIRLFWYLLFTRADLIGAIDLDTILPCYWVSVLRRKKRVYDAHELFCEMQEIAERPKLYRFWKKIERFAVPRFPCGYTVNQPIAGEFHKMYQVQYEVIRNMPMRRPFTSYTKDEKFILYQGAVNEGRSFDTLIEAMQKVPARLFIAGDGNYMQQVKELIQKHKVEHKVVLLGKLRPDDLWQLTQKAWIGITLFESTGQSNFYSLANRYFDYIQAGIPQLCVDYPVYRELNNSGAVALLTSSLQPADLASGLETLLNNNELYNTLQTNCIKRREELSWQEEEKKLLEFYQHLFSN